MVKYVYYESGAVLCIAPDDYGSVMALCTDPMLTLHERADKARQQVQEILDKLKADTLPQPRA